LEDGVGGERAGFASEFATVADEDQRWNGADPILLRGDGKLLGIYFDNEELAVGIGGDFGKFGRNHFAGAAPWRPEVDEEREGGTLGDGLECGMGRGIDRMGWNFQFVVAVAAAESLAEALVRQAVAFTALLAREDDAAFVEYRVQIPCNHRCHDIKIGRLCKRAMGLTTETEMFLRFG
jgi:hypothetical protein